MQKSQGFLGPLDPDARMHSWMGHSWVESQPQRLKAEMPPRSPGGTSLPCGMNTETQRRGLVFRGLRTLPTSGHMSSRSLPVSGPSPLPVRGENHPGKGVPWHPVEHHGLPACKSGMWAVDPEPLPVSDAGVSWVLACLSCKAPPRPECRGQHSVLSSD